MTSDLSDEVSGCPQEIRVGKKVRLKPVYLRTKKSKRFPIKILYISVLSIV